MKCTNCGNNTLRQQLADLRSKVKGEPLIVPRVDALVCSNCDYKTIDGSRMAKYLRLASDVYRREHSLLTSTEIRVRRRNLGLNQEQFAAYLKVGRASVKRWELGQVQDRAMDLLIRLMTTVEEARENCFRVANKMETVVSFGESTKWDRPETSRFREWGSDRQIGDDTCTLAA